ncbi:4Fe-4S dicluster domain-containing protein [Pseudonocardia sp. GCM10023141]|uniref:4Fe-4S dicluster domain-containing protein n=1 Tax=Pseudonocardia sp. GCM10023141 TaxID=3252653 RepID=UPI003620FC27
MPYVITDACVDVMDRSCVDQCPVDCIREGTRMLYIDPEACIDCGACEPACPQEAIYLDLSLPEPLDHFRAVNAAFFSGTGHDPAGADPPAVRDLPRRDPEPR